MTEAETQALMEQHGITVTHQAMYHYKGFKYGSLMDALNYAERIQNRDSAAQDQSKPPNR